MRRLSYRSTTKNTKKMKEGETTSSYSELNRFLIRSESERKNYVPLPLVPTTYPSTVTTQNAFRVCVALDPTESGRTRCLLGIVSPHPYIRCIYSY